MKTSERAKRDLGGQVTSTAHHYLPCGAPRRTHACLGVPANLALPQSRSERPS